MDDLPKVYIKLVDSCRKDRLSRFFLRVILIVYNEMYSFRESLFNMTRRGGMKILRGAPNIFRHPKEGL